MQHYNRPALRPSHHSSEDLHKLTTFPTTFWDSSTKTVEQSREDIACAVRKAMQNKGISEYELGERSQLPMELISEIIEGSYDLFDSAPISKLEVVLGVRLNNL